jgi:uncharacterized protein DUF3558
VRNNRPSRWLIGLTGVALFTATACAGPTRPPPLTLDPIDVSSYASAPCSLLTPQRAVRRHLQPPGSPVSGTAPGCRWAPTTPKFPAITANATTTEGLADLHRSDFSYFHPGTVAGYPAITTVTGTDAPHAGHCSVRVGVAEHSRVDVTADYPSATANNPFSTDPCADATTLATEIVDALASGNP